LKHFF